VEAQPAVVGRMELGVGAVARVRTDGAAGLDGRVDQLPEPFELLDDDPALELALVVGRHVLEVAASALGHEGARRGDAVRRRLEDLDQLGAGPVLAVVDDPDADVLAGDRAGDEDGLALDAHDPLATMGEPVDGGVGGLAGQGGRSWHDRMVPDVVVG